ncbi:MAG: hypothetical protein WC350_02445 [Candidatus Micrarchaeia archaeon]|jgi:uncharacterized membrane protein
MFELTGDMAIIVALLIPIFIGMIFALLGISFIWRYLKKNAEKVKKIFRDMMVGIIAGLVGAWVVSTNGFGTSGASIFGSISIFVLNLGFFISLCGLGLIISWNLYSDEDKKPSSRNVKCTCFYSRRRRRY